MGTKILKETCEVDKHACNISAVFCLGDDSMVSGSDDGILKLWNAELKLVTQVDTKSGGVVSITASKDKLYTVTTDQTVKVWDAKSLGYLSTIPTTAAVPQKLFYDSGLLWIGDAAGQVLKIENEQEISKYELTEEIWDFCVTTADGPTQIYTARDRDIVFSEIVTGSLRSTAVVKGTIEGRYPVILMANTLCCLDREGRVIQVHENNSVNKFKLLREIPASDLIINAMCKGLDGTVYSGGYDGKVSLWDTSTGSNLGVTQLGSCVNVLVTAPNGAYAALADGRVVLVGP